MITLFISRNAKPVATLFLLLFFTQSLLAARLTYRDTPVLRISVEYKRPIKSGIQGFLNDVERLPEVPVITNVVHEFNTRVASPIAFATPEKAGKPFIGGPGQPEMQAFQSANANNMVDLFTGDFSYNIPLLDVGGYPINIAYRGGITMDQEASWVGLGWNINPGTISRNLRGIPDDFSGKSDSIKKVLSIRENKTVGVTGGADLEVTGLPVRVGRSLGIFHNNYKGWGIETAINATINSGMGAKGPLSGGLSITNNSQEGLTISPSLSLKFSQYDENEKAGVVSSFSTSLPYNSRSGLKGLQLSAGIQQYKSDYKNQKNGSRSEVQYSVSGAVASTISFASPTFTPSITMPLTSRQFSFTGKLGFENMVVHPNFFISGYVSKQRIEAADTLLALPSYGYLHFQDGAKNRSSLLDFNREKELPYREKPAMPHIAVPMYTYDAFSITGEGTGGMFRAYRGDIGFIHDHFMRTKDESDRVSVDIGIGNTVHGGVDLNINRAFTQTGPWLGENTLREVIDFKQNTGAFEAAYFRNPGEKTINSKAFYEAIGGDDVVAVKLHQQGAGSPVIQATNQLNRYKDKQKVGTLPLTPQNAVKGDRDKRSQVISYLTAKEADLAGLSRYIENYTPNQFSLSDCNPSNIEALEVIGSGLPAQYYGTQNLTGNPSLRVDPTINYDWGKGVPMPGIPSDRFSIRRAGRIKAPVTGTYTFTTNSDDGVRLWINDSLMIDKWYDHAATNHNTTVNLVEGEVYTIKMEYYENKGKAVIKLFWSYPGQASQVVPQQYLYAPAKDQYTVSPHLIKEKRVNHFRKENHISEVNVLNSDGRRYVYGLPVYNLRNKEVTFSVSNNRTNLVTGLSGYNHGTDNTTKNKNGKDWYYNAEEVPAYAHSFLLTGILSADYVDVTGNGISEDDLGDAIKFNYSKICGIDNPYKWRAPYVQDSVSLNEGLRTDTRDDKGNYVYGEKELWYMHSVTSKTMVATFVLEARNDLYAIDESGKKINDGTAKRLKEIHLYNKADFLKSGSSARPIKSVHFEYSYELCKGLNKPITDSGKLTLKRIWFSYNGNNKGKQNPYVFNYASLNPTYNTRSYDRWGNYKEVLQNPGSTAANRISNAEYPYTLQDSIIAANNVKAWMLDSIYLPSGGAIKVDYESDDYAYVQDKRAMQMFKVAGLHHSPVLPSVANRLYSTTGDHLYVFIRVPVAVSTIKEVQDRYLSGVQKLFFKLNVRMPSDEHGSGNEYISCYANLSAANAVGIVNSNMIWVKLEGISLKGDGSGNYSPLAKAAIQFLKLNLPSKAYPGSEAVDNLDLDGAVKLMFSLAGNIRSSFESFDRTARNNNWAVEIDTSRTLVRLQNPNYKKLGGGHRVKRITLHDKWDKMTGQKAAKYGKEYQYTKTIQVNGEEQVISSGVAIYEPGIGGEENPFRQPIEYVEKISALGPVTLGYSEEPLGESLFPSAGVGYSAVKVRTINYQNIKSANGFEETKFYTAYDFPTYTDRSVLDGETKKRYKPALSNFLRINARHYVSISQGFKIELNDMHGKVRSQATYAETDALNPITYTESIYRVENPLAEKKRLNNTVMSIQSNGVIDTSAVIGKDIELMVDMREQRSITNGNNISLNTDMFAVPFIPPFFLIPSFLNLAQREDNLFRSVATLKVIQRYGILDSVIHIDKGSKVSTRDMLYDSETGETLLTRTQNLFNDPVYNFSYPSHWAYDGMGMAYKNVGAAYSGITIRDGKIISGLALPDSLVFSSGDEILVAGKQATGVQNPNCNVPVSTFPHYTKLWAIDSSVSNGGAKSFYFVTRDGKPYNGFDISMKVVRSGRRNMSGSVGSFTSLHTPLLKDQMTQQYNLVVNTNTKIINAAANDFQQVWSISNPVCSTKIKTCPPGFTPDPTNPAQCVKVLIAQPTVLDSVSICLTNYTNENYSACGSFIYNSNHSSCSRVNNNNFWVNYEGYTGGACDASTTCILTPVYTPESTEKAALSVQAEGAVQDSSYTTLKMETSSNNQGLNSLSLSVASVPDSLLGPMNRSGIWTCQLPGASVYLPLNQWIGFTEQVYFPRDGIYYIGMGADNQLRVTVNDTLFKELSGAVLRNFEIWHVYPRYFSKGMHAVKVEGYNTGNVALFGLEIYNNTESELRSARCYTGCANPLNLLFSTRDAVNKKYYTYGCPAGYTLNGTICTKTEYASSSDSLLPVLSNSYVSGILGNWRSQKGYTYFSNRKEQNSLAATNVRLDGTFNDYSSFWNYASGQLKPQYDTLKWVWNAETTLFNKRGLEIENKDPLGRFNSGLYGYAATLPIAVAQNSKHNESLFDGFEDYTYQSFNCDTCTVLRHYDLGSLKNKITNVQKHSGEFSLKANANESLGLLFKTMPDTTYKQPKPRFVTVSNTCLNGKTGIQSIGIDTTARKEGFLPVRGKKMVMSVWVKEERDCNCVSYTDNRVVVSFTGSATTFQFKPSGAIIEGWQRYESVFTIPAGATQMAVMLEATGSSAVYFDDLRIHPYHANMKTFVYHASNLRLLAEGDENNYTSFYEYDDDGTVIRVKKETERGIKTIKETRNALTKQ